MRQSASDARGGDRSARRAAAFEADVCVGATRNLVAEGSVCRTMDTGRDRRAWRAIGPDADVASAETCVGGHRVNATLLIRRAGLAEVVIAPAGWALIPLGADIEGQVRAGLADLVDIPGGAQEPDAMLRAEAIGVGEAGRAARDAEHVSGRDFVAGSGATAPRLGRGPDWGTTAARWRHAADPVRVPDHAAGALARAIDARVPEAGVTGAGVGAAVRARAGSRPKTQKAPLPFLRYRQGEPTEAERDFLLPLLLAQSGRCANDACAYPCSHGQRRTA